MNPSSEDQLLFSVAGARGIVGTALNVDVVTRLALAFASVLPPGPIVVGRDTRPSGASLMSSVIGAVTATGRECISVGIATTPTVEMMVEKLGAIGGIIVTASHNPVQWNALKFLDRRGIFITSRDAERVRAVYDSGAFRFAEAIATGDITQYDRAAADHTDAILALHILDVDRIAQRRFKIVLDCINGAGSVIAPDLLRALGAEVIVVNGKTDGNFFRDPEPRPENLAELARQVRAQSADVGFALDPDADRLAVVDDTGRAVSEEYTLALAVDHVLEIEKKGPVVLNMSTSALVDWIAARHQASVLRTPVGEAHVVARMLAARATIGGEGNGGVIYPELHAGRDAMVGMALILQLLAHRDVSLSEQIRGYPEFHMVKRKIPLGGEFSVARISELIQKQQPAAINVEDGVKAVYDDGWCHIRVSNTEGVVRVITESMSPARTADLQNAARDILESAWSVV